jgi:hypothetical protein
METKNTLESLLADLLSKDATRIWSSACAVNTCFDRGLLLALSDHMDKIRAATANIALGGALHPNSEHLRNAIARMAFVREEKGCLCALYGIFDDPTREAEAGRVSISGTVLSTVAPTWITIPAPAWLVGRIGKSTKRNTTTRPTAGTGSSSPYTDRHRVSGLHHTASWPFQLTFLACHPAGFAAHTPTTSRNCPG